MMNNMFQNPMMLMQSINQFRQNLSGDPRQMVQQMITSGRINQNQLNQAQQMATQIQQMFRGMK